MSVSAELSIKWKPGLLTPGMYLFMRSFSSAFIHAWIDSCIHQTSIENLLSTGSLLGARYMYVMVRTDLGSPHRTNQC